MPICTQTIQDSINFCKRMSFNRNPVIGNSLEPALTAATLVMQAILSPPFEWWWNNEELVFTCSPVPNFATSTSSTSTAGTLTVTAANTFAVNNLVTVGTGTNGFTGALAALNGQIFEIATVSPTGFTIILPAGAPTGTDTSSGVFTNVTAQDYTIPVPNFSHIEHASVLDLVQVPGSNPPVYTNGKWFELSVKNNLSLEQFSARPTFIGPHIEDGNGNMTFRLSPAPDKPYPISIHVQLTAPSLETLGVNSLWAPIPDFMQYIYNYGFLALMWMFADDPRFTWAEQMFKSALLGRSEGLTEEEKNIFLANWDNLTSGQMMNQQQGKTARAQ